MNPSTPKPLTTSTECPNCGDDINKCPCNSYRIIIAIMQRVAALEAAVARVESFAKGYLAVKRLEDENAITVEKCDLCKMTHSPTESCSSFASRITDKTVPTPPAEAQPRVIRLYRCGDFLYHVHGRSEFTERWEEGECDMHQRYCSFTDHDANCAEIVGAQRDEWLAAHPKPGQQQAETGASFDISLKPEQQKALNDIRKVGEALRNCTCKFGSGERNPNCPVHGSNAPTPAPVPNESVADKPDEICSVCKANVTLTGHLSFCKHYVPSAPASALPPMTRYDWTRDAGAKQYQCAACHRYFYSARETDTCRMCHRETIPVAPVPNESASGVGSEGEIDSLHEMIVKREVLIESLKQQLADMTHRVMEPTTAFHVGYTAKEWHKSWEDVCADRHKISAELAQREREIEGLKRNLAVVPLVKCEGKTAHELYAELGEANAKVSSLEVQLVSYKTGYQVRTLEEQFAAKNERISQLTESLDSCTQQLAAEKASTENLKKDLAASRSSASSMDDENTRLAGLLVAEKASTKQLQAELSRLRSGTWTGRVVTAAKDVVTAKGNYIGELLPADWEDLVGAIKKLDAALASPPDAAEPRAMGVEMKRLQEMMSQYKSYKPTTTDGLFGQIKKVLAEAGIATEEGGK